MTTTFTNTRVTLALVCTPLPCSRLSWIESSRQECRESHSPSLVLGNCRPRLSPNALDRSVQPASGANLTKNALILSSLKNPTPLKKRKRQKKNRKTMFSITNWILPRTLRPAQKLALLHL